MIRLLQFLLHGCWHRWEKTGRVTDVYDVSFGSKSFEYRAYETCCTKCGRYSRLKSEV